MDIAKQFLKHIPSEWKKKKNWYSRDLFFFGINIWVYFLRVSVRYLWTYTFSVSLQALTHLEIPDIKRNRILDFRLDILCLCFHPPIGEIIFIVYLSVFIFFLWRYSLESLLIKHLSEFFFFPPEAVFRHIAPVQACTGRSRENKDVFFGRGKLTVRLRKLERRENVTLTVAIERESLRKWRFLDQYIIFTRTVVST